jgi:glycosyltransferase involved in cell wall biosynthesis
MKRLCVCQVITELAPGGAEQIVCDLALGLDRDRYDVEVAALRGGAYAQRLRDAGVRVTLAEMRHKLDLGRLGRLRRRFCEQPFDLVHTHLFHGDLAGRWALRRSRQPATLIHSVHAIEARVRPWQFAFARCGAGRYARIVTPSHAVRNHHARRTGLPVDLYEVIPNGVDVDRFCFRPDARNRLRAAWAIGPEDALAGFVGRLHPDKGADLLLQAFAMAVRRRPELRLVVAGDGTQRTAMERFVRDHDLAERVVMLGHRTDVPEILSACDFLVMPSRWEGFGLSAVEAMSCGRAVLAGDAAGLAEVVEHDQTGLLTPRGDVSALAEGMVRLVEDASLRERLGQTGQQRVRQCYTRAGMLAAYDRLYSQAARPGG